ncbi:hypothetical protein B4102_3104 [Heyndrickxia sporothermodurans]|uniref:Uncharacterized protein n=1 Tax=Heyndrickxia sporothermodurans TaxID=46224 RepID=A0A150L0T2_9BACI|nr:hypothetical protein B4102_3104 [Heyndrickxia sporothermodurans]
MKNRDKRRKRKRDFLKNYLKDRFKNWKPNTDKSPVSNSERQVEK